MWYKSVSTLLSGCVLMVQNLNNVKQHQRTGQTDRSRLRKSKGRTFTGPYSLTHWLYCMYV